MAKTRSELREKAMIILYQIDILKSNNCDFNVENLITENLEVDNEFVRNIVYGVETHLESIDELANSHMKDWSIKRIDKTGAAILRMGIFEILYESNMIIGHITQKSMGLVSRYYSVGKIWI